MLGNPPSNKGGPPHDTFTLGRRGEILRNSSRSAISSYLAEEDKSTHHLEVPFRNFNIALVDNASAEYSFVTEFFSSISYSQATRKFMEIFEPTFSTGQSLTKQLVENTTDCFGLLICVRLNQQFAFELQRRRIPALDSYVNGTNMLLWPRFQIAMDMHCESLKRVTAATPIRGAATALSLMGGDTSKQSTAPHFLTQRFGQFLQGILALSGEAGDDEPVSNSLFRLRSDFEALLSKLSKSMGDNKKKERFLFNNFSLVQTIISVRRFCLNNNHFC